MAQLRVESDIETLAKSAAEMTVSILTQAIAQHGQAHWLLSGGTAPMEAYKLLASTYAADVDWDKVMVAIGDERCVPLDHPDANWLHISRVLLERVPLPIAQQLRPHSDLVAEEAAQQYTQSLMTFTENNGDIPHFDLIWLGMGEDGHTLSLFPNHPSIEQTDALVIAVHDSPKPPPDRMSLTLRALQNTDQCIVMASGVGKTHVIDEIFNKHESFPITQAIETVEQNGGQVTWLLDKAAAAPISV